MTTHSVLSSLSSVTVKGGYVYLSLVASQGGGIHTEEEFDLWIRVNGLFSPGKR
jgi:hypothetical protein